MTRPNPLHNKTVAIIGGGPAGLMVADVLSQALVNVQVYDAMPSVGRKFLLAGKGGMNITHSEPFAQFVSRYGKQQALLQSYLESFSPKDLRTWLQNLGIQTFVGSSGRVFPVDMKAAPLLRAWLHRLRERNVSFFMHHEWFGWDKNSMHLHFVIPEGQKTVQADAVVLALGGASWKHLGSTGRWWSVLHGQGIALLPLQPANCGFNMVWSNYFREHFAGIPLKQVGLWLQDEQGNTAFKQIGECMVTEYGLEGGLIYAASSILREKINQQGYADVVLDLIPNRDNHTLLEKLRQPRGKESWSNYLRKRVHLDRLKIALLKEVLDDHALNAPEKLAIAIKNLPIRLISPRPIDEAISSSGGVCFSALDQNLMLKQMPGVFCAGEMLDWEAPTGGYLLTACLATGKAAGLGVLSWLKAQSNNHGDQNDGNTL